MRLNLDAPDPECPNETKTAFKQRFLASLPETFQAFTIGREFEVLRVRSGFHQTIWEWLAFWRPLELHKLPVKASWAAEALTEHGYDWKLRWYRYPYSNAKCPAIFVRLRDASSGQPALHPTKPRISGRTHLKLVWDRDVNQ
jgi:hypothetical protein